MDNNLEKIKNALQSTAKALARKNIKEKKEKFNTISPPQLFSLKNKEEIIEARVTLDSQALKRQLQPNDVAQMVMFLASDQSSGCTKQNFIVDAGIT